MALKQGLLGLLNYGEMTGYELAKAFNDSLSFFWQAQTSQIYRELNQLEAEGLLHSRIEVQTGKPDKRVYAITAQGKAELDRWLASDLSTEMMPTRSEVLLRIFFSGRRSPHENREMLERLAQVYEVRQREMESVAGLIEQYQVLTQSPSDAVVWEMTADFGRSYTQMCQDWIDRCIARLKEIENENSDA